MPSAPKYNVFDGGSLLHRFKWRKGATFDEIAQVYVGYVKRFSNPVVVFDGYETSSSTKHGTHMRRSKRVIGPKVLFTGTMTMNATKEQFLGSTDKTQNFITFLSEKLEADCIRIKHADGDTDLMRALTGVQCAILGVTYVIGEDTDLLVLLCHHAQPEMHELVYRSDKSDAKSNKSHPWVINLLRDELGELVADLLPLVHAVGGCDTTSRLYGIGKALPLKKVMADTSFRAKMKAILDSYTEQGKVFSWICMEVGRSRHWIPYD